MTSKQDEPTMWLSTRQHLRHGDAKWHEFTDFMGLSHLSEVRIIDSYWNPYKEGNISIDSIADLWDKLSLLQ